MRCTPRHVRFVAIVASLTTACLPSAARTSPERVRAAEEGARQAIANERNLNAAAIPLRTIAVPPLQLSVRDSTLRPLSFGLADLLMTDLAQSRRLRVVERLRLDALLRELTLVQSGLTDSSTAPRIGRLVEARQLVVGSVTQGAGNSIALDLRIADVVTGQVRSAINARSSLNEILRAEKALVYQIFAQLGVNLTAAERAAIEQRRTVDIAALLAYSRGVELEVQGNYQGAEQQFQRANTLDAAFTEASLRGRNAIRTRTSLELPGTPLTRAGATATEYVNTTGSFVPTRPGGGSVDPQVSVITQRLVTIIVTVITPAVLPR